MKLTVVETNNAITHVDTANVKEPFTTKHFSFNLFSFVSVTTYLLKATNVVINLVARVSSLKK